MKALNEEKRKKAIMKALVLTLLPLIVVTISAFSYGGILTKYNDVKMSEDSVYQAKIDSLNENEDFLRSLTALYENIVGVTDSTEFREKGRSAIREMEKIKFGSFTLGDSLQDILVDNVRLKLEGVNNGSNYEINKKSLDSLVALYKQLMPLEDSNFSFKKDAVLGEMGKVEFKDFSIGDSINVILKFNIDKKSERLRLEEEERRSRAGAETRENIANLRSAQLALSTEEQQVSLVAGFKSQLRVPLKNILNLKVKKVKIGKDIKIDDEKALYNQLESLIEICGNDCNGFKRKLDTLFGK